MEVISVSNLKWSRHDQTAFDALVELDGIGLVPFTAVPDSDTEYGREIWEKGVAGEYGPISEFLPLTPEEARAVMPNLTARQLRLGLLSLGKLEGVSVAIELLPEPDRSQAQIEWQYATEFRRLHPLIVQLIPGLELTDEQVDTVWTEFAEV
ncbi:hypothetical protein C5748_16155 [Phyllobacterium phragmitis]|uniref:Uncharacterized protein n=1 Tax=Phyllobacterium phragmitis TaxID=2670329 RepID=A0A2S9IP72_9HYPH|nr:hypothetical protein [Phyllobacterium phragmitis]PRD42329.1 hypothetical protein C5748_16155 [Phyllobacterium phragmitis]